jgi:hypothetical protein
MPRRTAFLEVNQTLAASSLAPCGGTRLIQIKAAARRRRI